MLTQDEIKQYKELGYVIPRKFKLEAKILAELQNALEYVLKSNPEIQPDRIMNTHKKGVKP
ncbi:MAG: hypothetical protein VX962_07760, partial [Pseudomonadota bacterium]|nr:hypothetical protein [Pseudomonadota bacterium]